ncbi:MAG: cadherin repeat domain-containing protein, partial [Gammaproteobacteria bacterium]|nr:cadherin repeat domain-containing protein [Gammaproteobacteria bacterium]
TLISVEASYTDGNGTPETVTSTQTAAVVNVNDNPVGFPTVTGTVTEDQILTADTSGISDADGLGAFSYQWLRDGVAIGGATASTYTLGDTDVGTLISVEVSYTDGNSTAEGPLTSAQTAAVVNVNDNPIGLPTITGTVTEDQILTADTSGISDADGLGAFSYQWLRDGVAIGAATASTYTLGDADVGTLISVEVSYTDVHGTPEGPLTSAQTAPVVNINDDPVITSDGGAASVSINVDENTTDVTDVTSSDVDGGTPAYSIIGGPEAGLFTIDPVTGKLEFNVAPDFEFPTDGGGINQYDLIVQISDGNGGTDTQSIRVIVLDVDESVPIIVEPPKPPVIEPPDPVEPEGETNPPPAIDPAIENTGVETLNGETGATPKADEPPVVDEQQPSEPEKVITPDIITQLPEELKIKPIDLAKFENKVELKKFDHKLLASLDQIQTEMQEHGNVFGLDSKTITLGTGTLLTAGYVSWILRSGALLSALLSTIPAWATFDPIIVLAARRSEERDKALTEGTFANVERVFENAAQNKTNRYRTVHGQGI